MSDPRPPSEPREGTSQLTDRTASLSLSRPLVTGFVVTLGGLLAYTLSLAFVQLSGVLISIAFGLFIALGLAPVVGRLERRGLPRAWSIVVVIAAFVLLGALGLLAVLPTVLAQIREVVRAIPTWVSEVQKTEFYRWLDSTMGDDASSLIDQATSFVTDPGHAATIGQGVVQAGVTATGVVSGAVIAVVLSLYFLASLPQMKNAFVRLAPARHRTAVAEMTQDVADSVGGYLTGMVILAGANAVVAYLLHLLLGLPVPLLMGLAAFCITLIPLIGSVLYWGIASALALFTGWVPALIFAVCYLVYMQLEAYVLTPRVMNRAVSVPGALVVIGALAGGTLLGLLGALIAIPVTASILLIGKRTILPRQDAKV
ncbi:AI-2E family transporter [Microbacterium koreense]|uniref:AI-2E family transporter n=1 Tax=Microbacterium koreense TaxID=323761 RepID=A0ABW2ZMP0_9MICO